MHGFIIRTVFLILLIVLQDMISKDGRESSTKRLRILLSFTSTNTPNSLQESLLLGNNRRINFNAKVCLKGHKLLINRTFHGAENGGLD